MFYSASIADLPGADLIVQGMADARAGKLTIPVCLLCIALPALQRSGLFSPDAVADSCPDPELTLYRLLRNEGGDAFARYNSLLRRVVSFEQSLRRSGARSSPERVIG